MEDQGNQEGDGKRIPIMLAQSQAKKMSEIEKNMREWHSDTGIEMTASDAGFYKRFAEDFEKMQRRINGNDFETLKAWEAWASKERDKRYEEFKEKLKEERKHDEYIETWNAKEWTIVDRLRAFWIDGKPRKSRIGKVKNPDYVGPKPITKTNPKPSQEQLKANKTDDPWN